MLAELTSAEDQLLAVLAWAAGDAALGVDAGLGDRMASAVGTTFTATQRMVDRVHRLGSGMRTNPHMPASAGFADAHVDVVQIAQLPDGRPALALHPAHFAGWKNDDAPLAFFGRQSRNPTGGSNQLTALTGVHFNVVNFQTAGDI